MTITFLDSNDRVPEPYRAAVEHVHRQAIHTDHDPVFEAHRWTANLRILEIDEIKTVPHVPLSGETATGELA